MKKQIPRWHNPVFLRMSGLLDKVLHKASLTQREDGHRLYGGRMVWMQCRFDRYQSKVRECLLRQLEPLEKEARRLVNVLRETTVPPAPSPGTDHRGGSCRCGPARPPGEPGGPNQCRLHPGWPSFGTRLTGQRPWPTSGWTRRSVRRTRAWPGTGRLVISRRWKGSCPGWCAASVQVRA